MSERDEHNLVLVNSPVSSAASVDKINSEFYGRFPYPWSPANFDYLHDRDFNRRMLNQDIGDWQHRTIPEDLKIWIGGCGTNQSVITALRFPNASVVGSDVSRTSLEIAGRNAASLGIKNLELRRESLNEVSYREQFDYVICTGVIHHNADPRATLGQLAAALKPSGVMELMVYNRFHWILPVAFQQAIRIFGGATGAPDFESELAIAKRLLKGVPSGTLLSGYLKQFEDSTEAHLADSLLQPVMYSYTVESLEEMAESCGLEYMVPCLNPLDKAEDRYLWNLEFKDPVLNDIYYSLPDSKRWQVANLFLLENSPMLWFYLQRKDAGRARKSERRICEEFLNTTFVTCRTTQTSYVRGDDGSYQLLNDAIAFPLARPDLSVRKIFDAVDGRRSMRQIFESLGLSTAFQTANTIRLKLTTSNFPYLLADSTQAAAPPPDPRENDQVGPEEPRDSGFRKFKTIKPKAITLTEE